MVRRANGRSWFTALAAAAALAIAIPAFAQSTGMIRGVVTDEKGQPIEGAKVTIEGASGGRRYETKTNKKGEYLQIGLVSQQWSVTAEKDKLASQPAIVATRANTQQVANLVLNVASAAAGAEAKAKNEAIQKLFDEGVQLSNTGDHDAAIAKFQEAIGIVPTCYDCYNNIAISYSAKKDLPQAEATYKKSLEAKENVGAYVGLATLYFNAGKTADAKPLAEKAVELDASSADAHYIYGMTLVGVDPAKAVPEFETFLKLSPSGPPDRVKMANDILAAFKK